MMDTVEYFLGLKEDSKGNRPSLIGELLLFYDQLSGHHKNFPTIIPMMNQAIEHIHTNASSLR